MYTIDDLTTEERKKLQAGLRLDLFQTIPKYSRQTIRALDRQDIAAADNWIQLKDGRTYRIADVNIPESWQAGKEWVNYIVTLAKAPAVTKVGILRELPFTEISYTFDPAIIHGKVLFSPDQMIEAAYQGKYLENQTSKPTTPTEPITPTEPPPPTPTTPTKPTSISTAPLLTAPPSTTEDEGQPRQQETKATSSSPSLFPFIALLVGGGIILYIAMRR